MEELAVSHCLARKQDRYEGTDCDPGRLCGGCAERYGYLSSSRSAADFIQRTLALLRPMGVVHFSHHQLNWLGGFLDPFGTLPDGFMPRYIRDDFLKEDLALRHLLISNSPILRHNIEEHIDTAPYESEVFRRNQQLAAFLVKYQLNNSFYMPISRKNYKAVFWVSFDSDMNAAAFEAVVAEYRRDLAAIANMVDVIGREKFHADFHNHKKISLLPINGKPLQLLETLARKDLSLNEAAEVLEISISTANQHVAAAKKALSAHTLHGAILAALQLGLIVLDT
jgi:DNA-binding CsgD family transcriptional regulator